MAMALGQEEVHSNADPLTVTVTGESNQQGQQIQMTTNMAPLARKQTLSGRGTNCELETLFNDFVYLEFRVI